MDGQTDECSYITSQQMSHFSIINLNGLCSNVDFSGVVKPGLINTTQRNLNTSAIRAQN